MSLKSIEKQKEKILEQSTKLYNRASDGKISNTKYHQLEKKLQNRYDKLDKKWYKEHHKEVIKNSKR